MSVIIHIIFSDLGENRIYFIIYNNLVVFTVMALSFGRNRKGEIENEKTRETYNNIIISEKENAIHFSCVKRQIAEKSPLIKTMRRAN